jgi:hypothetical protein
MIRTYPNVKGGNYYDIYDFGAQGRLEGLTKRDLEQLRMEIIGLCIDEELKRNETRFL